MFDIGFWELAVIGLVALLVLGPERLPAAARTAGQWLGRARRTISQIRTDIESELDAGELKNSIESAGLRDLEAMGNDIRRDVSKLDSDVRESVEQVQKSGEDHARSE